MDTSSPEFQAALRDHARSLGVDPDAESHLLGLVQEALLADTPEGWEQGETEDGTLYYFNADTDESIWEHPLDSHYRDLIKQKKAEGPPKPKPIENNRETPPKTEVSKLEVYSFDEDSDDDSIKPASRVSALGANDKSSRIGALFTSQPAPAISSAVAASTASVKDSVLGRTSTTSSTAGASSGGGFGRDRSWLLDNDDDLPTVPLTRPSTSASSSTTTTATSISSFETKDYTRPTTTGGNSSLPYMSRLFGTDLSTPASSTVSISAASSTDGGRASSGEKLSPRRGIASAIKGPFFQDMSAESTAPTTQLGASSLVADSAKIKDLEKTNVDLSRQLDQLKKELENTKQQLETAKQDAKEANYLKMKSNETKTKLTEKENELAMAKQDTARLQDEIEKLQDECATLRQIQKSATQQEVVDAKKAISEMQILLSASQKQASEAETALSQYRRECEKVETQLKDVTASLERERKDTAGLKGRIDSDDKEKRALRDQVEATKLEMKDAIAKLKQEMTEQSQKFESVMILQDTLDRQAKHIRELEEKQKDTLAKVSEAETRENQAIRETKNKEQELHEINRRLANLTQDLETRDRQIRDLNDKLRQEQAQASEVHGKAMTLQRNEDEFERKRQFWGREKQDLNSQIRDRIDQIHALQGQVQKAHEENVVAISKLQMEIHTLTSQLKQVKSLEVLPLEKQRDQLTHEMERVREKLIAVENELRTAQQELTDEATKSHQLQVEIEAWKRKEQQQKTQKETYLHEKMNAEKQLQSLQGETSAYKHDKRLEIEKLAFRLRELESQVAQKDYEIVRVEEKFTKAEAWRLKEARRVEEREAQLLDVKEELAQLRSRNIEAENNLIIHELRREKEQLESKNKTLGQDLEEERVARQVAAQKFQDEAENLQKAIEWQLPQLAAACVTRSSEEWTKKCNDLVKALRDDWNMKALTERNELMQRLKEVDERRDHVEQKLKNTVSECEFLRKEVHRVEDNNKVLLDQLHTIRVYMTQRAGASVFPTMSSMGNATTAPSSPPVPPPAPPPPQPHQSSFHSDFSAVNQLNTQLAVLHSQFQQLFDAHAEPRRPAHVFSPSDRFEIPSSPPSQTRKKARDSLNTSTSTVSSSSSLDETLDSILLDRRTSSKAKDPHKDKEELLATLASIGGTSISGGGFASVVPVASTGDSGDTMWYQKNYWRTKYQT